MVRHAVIAPTESRTMVWVVRVRIVQPERQQQVVVQTKTPRLTAQIVLLDGMLPQELVVKPVLKEKVI